ncbi:MAG: CehA/McbA family metallohydrolase [bacterium]
MLTLIAGSGCERQATPGTGRAGAADSTKPTADVISRGRAGLHAVVPSVALAGEPVKLTVAPLTDLGTPDLEWRGTLEIESTDGALVSFGPFAPHQGAFARDIVFRTPGFQRVTVRSDHGETAIAGPVFVARTEEELRVRAGEPARRLYWGDAHGHTDLGDGTNPPTTYLAYARDVARLDFTCVSEHDLQQYLDVGFDTVPSGWDSVRTVAEEFRRPGFAVLLGWEWSSREWGHRVVLFPGDEPRYVSFQHAPTPAALARELAGTGAVSVLAHPTGSRLTPPIVWEGYVPGFDRAIEIYSGHGSNDESDFRETSDPDPGRSALESIRRGLPLGIVAFSDTHLSTPGNPWPPEIRDAPWPGGLTAVWAEQPTEASILDAIANGRCYATSGPRFYVEATLDDRTFGETLELRAGTSARLRATIAAPGNLREVQVRLGGKVYRKFAAGGPQMEIELTVGPFDESTAVWLTGRSEDDERLWTTPIRVLVP